MQIREMAERRAQETSPPFNDEAVALHFARRRENDLRYVAAWSKWVRCSSTAFINVGDRAGLFRRRDAWANS